MDTDRFTDFGLTWFEKMKQYVLSDEWKTEDGDPTGHGVYLCLNMLINVSGSELELKRKILDKLAEEQIHFNPYNMTIDAISPLNEGVNLGIVVDEREISIITNSKSFCIANAIKRGKQFKPEIWENEPLPFDFRPGSGGKGVLIKF